MGLRLYNTLTGQKEDFSPFDADNVRMYVCGPTVYDYAHIGNARPVIVFDVLFRLLRHIYGPEHVTYVRNVTDVDDKINARAAEAGVSIETLTDGTLEQFHADVDALGCLRPTYEPRATKFIAPMRSMIETLVRKDHAYVEADHVLFSVSSFTDYGRLSNRALDEMIAGARVEVAPYKRNPMDFVLWKPSDQRKSNILLPKWQSPCNIEMPGRPGWHIECSAMSDELLGKTFDIHGGGIDLVFPHHENEIAQSRCAHGTPLMARYWMHNGFLQVEGKKMAKSEENFVTIRELLRGWSGEPWSGPVIRLAMLRSHYRQPIDWSYHRLYEARADVRGLAKAASWEEVGSTRVFDQYWEEPITLAQGVEHYLFDDLNTAGAVNFLLQGDLNVPQTEGPRALIHSIRLLGLFTKEQTRLLAGRTELKNVPTEISREATELGRDYLVASANNDVRYSDSLRQRMDKLGLNADLGGGTQYGSGVRLSFEGDGEDSIESLVDARAAARKAKNFAEADRIRDELHAMGIQIEDSKDPKTGELITTWEVKR